jgi:hypothetical protein
MGEKFGHLFYKKGLIPRIYNKSPKLNTERTQNPINNVQINGTVFRSTNGKYIYVEMFDILSYKEMQIKITLRFRLTPVRVAVIRKQTCLEGCGEQQPLYAAGGNVR